MAQFLSVSVGPVGYNILEPLEEKSKLHTKMLVKKKEKYSQRINMLAEKFLSCNATGIIR